MRDVTLSTSPDEHEWKYSVFSGGWSGVELAGRQFASKNVRDTIAYLGRIMIIVI